MPISRNPLLLLVLALFAAAPAAAQQRQIVPGDRVRVASTETGGERIVGEVTRYENDTLVVRQAGTEREFVMPTDHVRRLSRSEGRNRGRSVRSGARVGLFLGAAAGFVAGPLIASTQTDDDAFLILTPLATLGGAALGAGLGAAGGAAFGGEHWQEFRMPIPRTPTVAIRAGREPGIAISIPMP